MGSQLSKVKVAVPTLSGGHAAAVIGRIVPARKSAARMNILGNIVW